MSRRNRTVSTPVTPRPLLLPLGNLHEERFEAFCHDLVARLPRVARCNRYGGRGDLQEGIATPSLSMLFCIAGALGIGPAELIQQVEVKLAELANEPEPTSSNP